MFTSFFSFFSALILSAQNTVLQACEAFPDNADSTTRQFSCIFSFAEVSPHYLAGFLLPFSKLFSRFVLPSDRSPGRAPVIVIFMATLIYYLLKQFFHQVVMYQYSIKKIQTFAFTIIITLLKENPFHVLLRLQN
jgi:hypothetical protein